MLGEQRDHLLHPLARPRLDEAAYLEVLLSAHGLRKHLVGRIADERMLERELGLAGERAAVTGDDDVLLPQRAQRLSEIAALGLGDSG